MREEKRLARVYTYETNERARLLRNAFRDNEGR